MQRILVLGLQRTGKSVLRFFQSQEGVVVSAYAKNIPNPDRECLDQEFPYTLFYSGELKEILENNQFDLLVLSPGFSIYLPEIQEFIKNGGEVTGDIQLWLTYVKQPEEKLIAITGSNGKSTVAELVGFLCRQSGLSTVVAGNIGLPVLVATTMEQKKIDVWVLELSSFQLETIQQLSSDAATCLNISEDHLERYEDLLDYAQHKSRIFNGAKVQVLNLDDVLCCAMRRDTMKTLWFSTAQVSDYWVDTTNHNQVLMCMNDYLVSMQALCLVGLHNASNILVALALCESIGLNRHNLLAILPFFKGLPHRMEKIGELNAVSFIDDSKGTNVGATVAALESAPVELVLIAGGLGKGQDFSLLKYMVENKVKALFLIGQAAIKIAQVFHQSTITPIICDSLEDATRKAYAVAPANSWVLLSPACASMDMFDDYIHRAKVFINTFEELQRESAN